MTQVAWPYLVGSAESGGQLAPLFLKAVCGETDEQVTHNLRNTLSREYVPFNTLMDSKSGSVSIVGSAPSLKNTYDQLVGDSIAVNQAHDFLIDKGITPTYGVIWDAGEILKDFIRPVKGVTYLIASRVHPETLSRFDSFPTVIWHALGDGEITHSLLGEANRMEPIIGGGSGGVTRLMFVAHVMGYRDIHLFGADSSCEEGAHVTPNPAPQTYMDVNCLGEWFRTTPQLASQIEDFKILAPMLKAAGSTLSVHGVGLLPKVARELGFDVVTPSLTT